MAVLPILRYPDPRLRKSATAVDAVDAAILSLAADMAATMYAAPGIGLAATQVNVHKQLIVIDVSEDRTGLMTFINPEIIEQSGECEAEEGCLSVPGIYEPVKRARRIVVRALDLTGRSFELEAEGLLGACIQHEMDHLLGRVFVDYLSRLKQVRIRSKMEKRARDTA